MDNLFEALPSLASYHPALLALALLSLAVLIQGVLTAPLAFARGDEEPGMPLKGDHAKFSFRVIRTYANSVENFPAFIATLFLAIIVGVDPTWVNWLAGLHVGFRLLFWVVYFAGIGKVAGGPRTMSYVGGWLTNTVLAGMTVYAFIV
ncbi:MAG: MAPEG family protein [Novosphingobium sp.]|nr:MAPEG family protein [Novosphingobium sp.]